MNKNLLGRPYQFLFAYLVGDPHGWGQLVYNCAEKFSLGGSEGGSHFFSLLLLRFVGFLWLYYRLIIFFYFFFKTNNKFIINRRIDTYTMNTFDNPIKNTFLGFSTKIKYSFRSYQVNNLFSIVKICRCYYYRYLRFCLASFLFLFETFKNKYRSGVWMNFF